MTTPSLPRGRARARLAALLVLVVAGTALGTRAAGPTYFPDDPIRREPSSQDASGVAAWDIPLA